MNFFDERVEQAAIVADAIGDRRDVVDEIVDRSSLLTTIDRNDVNDSNHFDFLQVSFENGLLLRDQHVRRYNEGAARDARQSIANNLGGDDRLAGA